MKKFLYLLMLSIIQLIMNSNAYSQIGIGPTNFTPNASAGLDINFVDKGLLIPRVDLSNYLLTIAANAPGLPSVGPKLFALFDPSGVACSLLCHFL